MYSFRLKQFSSEMVYRIDEYPPNMFPITSLCLCILHYSAQLDRFETFCNNVFHYLGMSENIS